MCSVRASWALVAACLGGCGAARDPSALGADFCAASVRGDLTRASRLASELTATAPEAHTEAVDRLRGWLSSLPCVAHVTVSPTVIETDPGTREVTFVLRANGPDVARACEADVTLDRRHAVHIHPAKWSSGMTDTRCTPVD